MKKFFLSCILVVTSLFADECGDIIKKLVSIQNSIVQYSYQNLQVGAWAKFTYGLAIYAGKREVDGKKLYGVELQPKPSLALQTWYSIIPKKLAPGVTLLTLDPTILYVLDRGGHVIKLNKNMIELYYTFAMGGRENLSTILTPAILNNPPRCDNRITIKKIQFTVQNRNIPSFLIVSQNSGGRLVVSDKVPFGIVASGDGSVEASLKLLDFGFHGKKPLIDEKKHRMAQEFSIHFGM
ncbi:hypothetical protein [Nitratiruptor sp. YY09-18]|uniref:hypothetical protein n=1 Tax=Nitratiruptor sp. YY09-18 TaxID=2724901 RepID=UPI0019151A8F|nr:hypothetical protein [Nitratiruptor sp. YY09-18]BCD67357.1 hypothetical protein NitYY0918_C0242 [Nitratiruptor sp. YY09-18]